MQAISMQTTHQSQPGSQPKNQPQASVLLQGVIECLLDGILIVTDSGQVIKVNQSAQAVCDRLTPHPSIPDIPQEIWRVCQSLIDSRQAYDPRTNPVLLEDEISTDQFPQLRIRARWVSLKTSEQPYILVFLEDRYLANQRLAIAEATRYRLTPRETEVWQLYRTNCPREAIAAQLFISINTVKKHIKSILAKRRMLLDDGWN